MSLARLAGQLLPTLSSLLPTGGVPPGELVRGFAIKLIVGAITAILVAVAFGFGLAAIYMSLAFHYGGPAAAGFIAAGLLLLAAISAGIMAIVASRQRRRRQIARLTAQANAMAPINQFTGRVAANPLRSLLLAAVAGAIAGWLDRRI